jgi:hypothetical protein
MCLAVFQPKGDAALDRDILKNGWTANPDGAGYMFAADGKLVIRKPFYSLKRLRKAYYKDHAAFGATSHFVVHFRYATHGDNSTVNIHPHILGDGRAGLVHNGILDIEPPATSDLSDTAFFCRTILACREPAQLTSGVFGGELAEMIGPANKFILMDECGNVSIVNADSGVWDGSRWFSNSGYKDIPFRYRGCASMNRWSGGDCEGSTFRGTLFSDPDKLSEAEWQEHYLDATLDDAIARDDVNEMNAILEAMGEASRK